MSSLIHEFTLVLKGAEEITESMENAIFEAGCDDALLGSSCGRVTLDFSRAAPSLKQAIVSAIQDVRKAGYEVLRIDLTDIVTQSDIARIAGKSRQYVHQLIKGKRGEGFPRPVSKLDSQPAWSLPDVMDWLTRNALVSESQREATRVIGSINCLLTLSHHGAKLSKREFSRITGRNIRVVQ